MNRPWIDGYGTLVRVLQRAFAGSTVDIRPLLTQSCSTTADHETSERQRFEELLAVTRVDEAIVGAGVRPQIMVFDDVLNSRKHFKVAQQLLLQRFPGTSIIGVFLARCLPDPPLEFEPLPDVD